MTLRKKSLLLVAAALMLLTGFFAGGSWFLLHDNLDEAERLMVNQEVKRGVQSFRNDLSFLDTQLWEYACWDDTYAFAQNGNRAYIQTNFTDNFFSGGRRNIVILLDRQNRIMHGRSFDYVADRQQDLPRSLLPFLRSGSPLVTHPDLKSKVKGILSLPEGPMLFASRPILTSQETGPSRGTIIMGRLFTRADIERLSLLLNQKITFSKLEDPPLPPAIKRELIAAGKEDYIAVEPANANVVAGYTILRDIYGKPALVMRMDVPRVLHRQGEQTIHFLVTGIVLIGILSGFLILWFLERLVLSRLQIMSDEVNRIGESGNHLHRVSVSGRDELANLAGSINGMLETIEATRETIREESERYRAVVEDQTEFICRFGFQGNLIFANEALGRYLNQPPEGVLGGSFFKIFPWANAAEIRGEIAAIDAGQPVRMFDAKMIFPEERIQWSRWTVRAILNEHGEIREYQAVGRDITGHIRAENEKKVMEEQFFQAQKMEAIGTLAGGIAHDFNNILMGIGGYVSLMLYDISMDHPHYRKLKAIEEQIKNAASLTKDLLGFARGGAYEIKPSDLNRILETTSSIFGRSRKDIHICHRFEPDLWTVNADRGQMEQVYMNLFVNAAQAMPAGGNIYLETKNVTIAASEGIFIKTEPGPYVQVAVTDEGIGMDEETKERIFEPFFTTRDREKRGSGLGLASVYGIIKNHGGVINVYTEKGVGTTFRIYLPAVDSLVTTMPDPDWTHQQLLRGSEGILVVDDEALLMDVTVKMLNILGYRVYTALSGSEALETYGDKRGQIDLVLLDMIMPGMSGEETFRKLKEMHPEIKVILASGYSLNDQATRIMENGCRAFLQKPYNAVELSRTLRDVLDQLF